MGARLDRALHAASLDRDGRPAKQTLPVQVLGEAHRDGETYRRWRERQLRRVHGASLPVLRDGEWALVLWAIRPSGVADLVLRGDTGGVMGPPIVGRFSGDVTSEVGLAATIAAWLQGRHAVLLAPPLLGEADGPYGHASLRRAWPLPVAAMLAEVSDRA